MVEKTSLLAKDAVATLAGGDETKGSDVDEVGSVTNSEMESVGGDEAARINSEEDIPVWRESKEARHMRWVTVFFLGPVFHRFCHW